MNTLLESSWRRAWHGLHANGDGLAVRDAVLHRYAETHRHYHTAQHLHECLALFERIRSAADRPHEVEMALWFHDAIYDLKASDNEERSAEWARDELVRAQVEADSAQRVHGVIMTTKHTASPQECDEKVLVDVDLSILGATDERFAEYEQQIRSEYSYVPGFLFRMKRKSILKSFLDGRPSTQRRFFIKNWKLAPVPISLRPSAAMRPNPSLKAATRYGSHRLAAPGVGVNSPSAASRRLPPRSP